MVAHRNVRHFLRKLEVLHEIEKSNNPFDGFVYAIII